MRSDDARQAPPPGHRQGRSLGAADRRQDDQRQTGIVVADETRQDMERRYAADL
jgi:hypothetical protein